MCDIGGTGLPDSAARLMMVQEWLLPTACPLGRSTLIMMIGGWLTAGGLDRRTNGSVAELPGRLAWQAAACPGRRCVVWRTMAHLVAAGAGAVGARHEDAPIRLMQWEGKERAAGARPCGRVD